MRLARALYTLALYLLMPAVLARLAWRARRQPGYLRHVRERFGSYAERPDRPVVWLHAVSVGETRAAEPLVKALEHAYPGHCLLLTHMTPTGRDASEELLGDRVLRGYLPYDLPLAVNRFLGHFRPEIGALLETELWPNLIHACNQRRTPLYLVNARLSERSARGYARFAGLTRSTLQELAGIGAQTEADEKRLSALGALRVSVTGNLKFDREPSTQDLDLGKQFRAWFGEGRHVFLAASTREGEEELVLEASEAIPADTLLVIVPRHPQRFDEVARLIQRRGLAVQRRSESSPVRPDTRVWLGDSMGELFAYYRACDVAFVGGSLLPHGGQNLLEACAVGKPVVVGPHTFNFSESVRLALEAGVAIEVSSPDDLGRVASSLLADPARRERMSAAGLALLRAHQGATRRTVELLRF